MSDQDSKSPANNQTAEMLQDFLEDEILKTQSALRNTRLFGIIIIVVVIGYMGYITKGLHAFLDPAAAAEMTTDFVETQLSAKTDLIADQIKARIPALVAELPDHFLKQIPAFRERLEDTAVNAAKEQMNKIALRLDDTLGTFLDEHKDAVNEMLTIGQDFEISDTLRDALTEDIIDYLTLIPEEEGKSVVQQLTDSLKMLGQAEASISKLADGVNLSAPERKTRYALAVLADSIEDQMQRLKLKAQLADAKAESQ